MGLVSEILKESTIEIPKVIEMKTGSKKGIHTNLLKDILKEMQYLPRKYPDAKW